MFRYVLIAALLISLAAVIVIPLRLASKTRIGPEMLRRMTLGSLWIAGILSGLMSIVILAAAAWGMDTHIAWGLGIYPYLIPALRLPPFLLLLIATPQTLSRVLWFLTGACGIAWYFGDRADRIASGMALVSDPLRNLGTFLNVCTLLFVAISLLVQMAAIFRRREQYLVK